jgi:predicted RNA-binding protein (virulence factor B family)
MIHLGEYNSLKIVRQTDNGVYLTDEEGSGEVLLPNKFVPETWDVGDVTPGLYFQRFRRPHHRHDGQTADQTE